MRDPLRRAEHLLPDVIDDAETLVRAESPTGDAEALRRSADSVAAVGRKRLGFSPERIEIDGRTHLVWRFGPGPPRLLMLAHYDTVWPLGSWGERLWDATDGIIRGPGCLDMATGIAQAMAAVSLLIEEGSPLDGVSLLVTADEEVGSPTSRALIAHEARSCRAVLVLEPGGPGGELKTERKGSSRYTVRLTGRAAHAGLEPHRGVNASVELAHQVLAITAFARAELGTTVTPTVLSAGTTTNTVPEGASFHVDVRTVTWAEQQRVDAAVRALPSVLDGTDITIEGGPNRPPLNTGSSADLFERARQLAHTAGLPPLRSQASGAVSDGNLTAHLGIPTLDGLGAIGGGVHAQNEHVLVHTIPARVALLALLVEDQFAGGSPAVITSTD